MSNVTPILFINGEAFTGLLKPLVAAKTKNTYFAASPQASMYGLKVDGSVLPDGLESVFTLGTNVEQAVSIPLGAHPDGKPSKRKGSIKVQVAGVEMIAEVVVNDFGDGTYNLKASVHRPSGGGGSKKAVSADSLR